MKFKVKNILLVSFLAIAGFFGISSTLINKQVNEQPVAEKAEAASYPAQWYITGNINGGSWGTWQKFTSGDNVNYSFSFTATTSTDFKISSKQGYDGYVINRAMDNTYLDYDNKGWGTYTDWESGDNFKIKYAGEYIISYNTEICTWDKPSWGFSISPVTHNIYYVSASEDPTTDKIYAWTGDGGAVKEFGNFPGKSIASVGTDVTGVVNFQGSFKKIYKISTHSVNFLFANSGGSTQSSDREVVDGAAYWWTGGANTDAGAALDLIVAEEDARNAVSAHGTIKNYSICGIDPDTASSLVSRYNSLTSDVASYVNSSTTKTYKGITSEEEQVNFTAIFAQLAKIASGNSKGMIRSFAPFNLIGDDENNLSTIIIIAASSVALLSVTALSILVIKKRKNKEE